MSGFHDVRFPLALSRGARVSVYRASEVAQLASGREIRNARWANSLRKWTLPSAILSRERLTELVAFFDARGGNVHGFRFRDALDFSSGGDEPDASAQLIGIGDGERRVFQLTKSSGDRIRTITKPVAGSIRVSVSGIETIGFQVDILTGAVTLDTPPEDGEEIRAGFLFDVPVRFENPSLDFSLDACLAGRAPNVSLVEIREASHAIDPS